MWELPLPEPVLREALPSPEVLAERLALIKMIVNLSVTSDEEKYTDVLESVQRWEYADLKAFQEKQKAAASAEQPTHRNRSSRCKMFCLGNLGPAEDKKQYQYTFLFFL